MTAHKCLVTALAVLTCALTPGLLRVSHAQETLNASGAFPSVRLYVDQPTVRDWQIGAGTVTIAIWDNTAVTIPFQIERAAPTNSLYVREHGGNVGIGTSQPEFPLHVVRTSSTAARMAQFTQTKANGVVLAGFENNALASIANEAGFDFVLQTSTSSRVCSRIISGFSIIDDGTRRGRMRFLAAQNGAFVEAMQISGNRVGVNKSDPSAVFQVINATCNGATWTDACSRTLKHDIAELSPEAARVAVMALRPVTYAYNHEPDDARVGFIAEDAPDLVATPDRQGLASMDIVAALTKVVQEQERRLAAQDERLETQAEELRAVRELLRDRPQ